MKFMNWPVESFQQAETLRRNARFDDTAVVGLALADDEGALLHAVEKTSHIRIVRNHVITDAAAGQAVRLGSTENAKNIVLRPGESGGFQELLGILAEGIRGLEKGNEGTGFEATGVFGAGNHGLRIVVITTIVKRKVSASVQGPA